MNSRKKSLIFVSVLVVLLIVIGVIIYICSGGETTNELLIGSNIENSEDNREEDNISDNDDNTAGSNNNETNDSDNDNLNNVDVEISINDNNENINNTYEYTEEDVIEYFSFMEDEVNESTSFKEKFKEYFVTIVDFIFYDKEIKGYTFNELSGTAKDKLISIALKIDSKIEEYVPNYKESISSTSSKIYTNIKEKLVSLYMDVSTDICKNNEEECNKVKEIFSGVKDVCSIGWDFIKGLFSSGGSKIKEWYEIYSGK